MELLPAAHPLVDITLVDAADSEDEVEEMEVEAVDDHLNAWLFHQTSPLRGLVTPENTRILQCPRCRSYWDTASQSWVRCRWLTRQLAMLCLSQLPPFATHTYGSDVDGCCHPHFHGATQKPTAEFRCGVCIEVVWQYRDCCYCGNSPDASANANLPAPVLVSEELAFSVKHTLCPTCKHTVDTQNSKKAGGKVSFVLRLFRELRSLVTATSRQPHSPSYHRRLNGDCCAHILPYLRVGDLNSLARVSHAWARLVRTSGELRQLARVAEAWDGAARQGVYVCLDRFYGVSVSTKASERSSVGGYLLPLPVAELGSGSGCRYSVAAFHRWVAAFGGVQWEYAVAEAPEFFSQGSSSSSNIPSSPNTTLLAAALLRCLRKRHQALLQHLRLLTGGGVVQGPPMVSRGIVILPFVVPEIEDEPTQQQQQQQPKKYFAFHLCFLQC